MEKKKRIKRGPGRPKKGELQPLEKELCYRIREVRLKHGYTQKDICTKVLNNGSMTENSYRRYENARLRIPDWMLKAFIDSFPDDEDYLIGDSIIEIEKDNENRRIQSELRAELIDGYDDYCFVRYLDSLGYKIKNIEQNFMISFYNKESVFKLSKEQYRKMINEVEHMINNVFKDNTSQNKD